ncbi:MAG: glycosyltransferase family 2 protein [Clostridium sp.]|nr:glycosyltransferase family 2 protein [Clostridium sp.]
MELNRSILKQKKINLAAVHYIVTESTDQTEFIMQENHIPYELIKKEEFSHSLTREKAAMMCDTDIVVFITQDIVIEREDWLYELTNPIVVGEVEAAFSRQLCRDNSIEKYTREINYPEYSRIVAKKDTARLGLNTFFFSNASSAIRRDVFVRLNGYDRKKLPLSEDMYLAYKLIQSGYRIKYCAKSQVIHSHQFTLKEQYARYRETGKFFRQNRYLNQYGTNKAGGSMAVYVWRRALEDRNWKVLAQFLPNMAARFFGMKVGRYFG